MVNVRLTTIAAILMGIAAVAMAQPSAQWVARYNGAENSEDFAGAMTMDGAGNIYVTGDSYSEGSFSDYATAKYDSQGNQLWSARYNGSDRRWGDHAAAIAVDDEGNVLVTGSSMGMGTGFDYATIKYDKSGNELWTARYNSPVNEWDRAEAIAVDASGNVYVTGYSPRLKTGYDYATIKYDANGRMAWVTRYDHGGFDQAKALALDAAGDICVTGTSRDADTGLDFATVKYDTDGRQLWSARYNSAYGADDQANAMIIDAGGHIYVTGYSRGAHSGDDYLTLKYDASGSLLWAARYNGPSNAEDHAEALAVDMDGRLCVTGYSRGKDGTICYTTVKYDSDGSQLWVNTYDAPINLWDHAEALAVDPAGNAYVAVVGRGADSSYDYVTLGYDSDGIEMWRARYNGPDRFFADHARAIRVDDDGNIYVLGHSWGVRTLNDYTLVKYSPGKDSMAASGPSPATQASGPFPKVSASVP